MNKFIIDFEHVDIHKTASLGSYGYHDSLWHICSDPSLVFFLETKLFKRPTVKCYLEYESVKGSKLLFSFSDSVSVFHNFPYTSVICLCQH